MLHLPKRHFIWVSVLAMGFLSLFSGCSSRPSPSQPIHTSLTQIHFQNDQQKRLIHLKQWQASALLEVVGNQGKKRFRTTIQGEKNLRTKITAFGPFRQIAMELFADPKHILLINPSQRTIIQVPSTESGMSYLIQIGLKPKTLFRILTGLSEPLHPNNPQKNHHWLTLDGEELLLDGQTGHILERFGQTSTKKNYHVVYQWPENRDNPTQSKTPPLMPSKIRILFESKKNQITVKVQKWQLNDTTFSKDWFSFDLSKSDFSVSKPFNFSTQ